MDELDWHRRFQVWQYSVSHSVLLLRSTDYSGDSPSRIDILFSAVSLMHLQDHYEPLNITVGDAGAVDRLLSAAEAGLHGKLFLLNGGEGYIVAANVNWHEDQGDYRAPSRFGPLMGTN